MLLFQFHFSFLKFPLITCLKILGFWLISSSFSLNSHYRLTRCFSNSNTELKLSNRKQEWNSGRINKVVFACVVKCLTEINNESKVRLARKNFEYRSFRNFDLSLIDTQQLAVMKTRKRSDIPPLLTIPNDFNSNRIIAHLKHI